MSPLRKTKTERLRTHTPELLARAVQKAAHWLQAGKVIALPTETVYGLAANATNPAAVARLFQVKGRPSANPIIVHVANVDMARRCVREWPAIADRLATAFWPGPLTLVLPKTPLIPSIVTAGGDTVGVRWPNHRVMQAVIEAGGFPLAAPSANLAGQTSPTTADHVLAQLGGEIVLVVDDGPTTVGIESTVLDLTGHSPRVLRPGMISASALAAVVNSMEMEMGKGPAPGENAATLRSPGLLPKHYAPQARLVVLTWTDESNLRLQVNSLKADSSNTHVLAYQHLPGSKDWGRVCIMPRDPAAYARLLYAELHRSDALGAGLIVVEAPPSTTTWDAIRDRLQRASAS